MLRQLADERAVHAVAVFRMRVFFQTAERRFFRRRLIAGFYVRMFFQRADQRAGLIVAVRARKHGKNLRKSAKMQLTNL